MKTDKNKKITKKLSQEKVVINSITDLLKIPIDKINNSKIENFTGEYFDKIYEEVIKNESQPAENKSSSQIQNKNQKEKVIDSKINKNISKKENKPINIIKPYYEEDFDIPKNKYRLEYKNKPNYNQRDEDTEDNDDEKTDKNDFYMTPPPPKENPKRKNSPIPINKMTFSVNYNSKFGEEVAILGSLANNKKTNTAGFLRRTAEMPQLCHLAQVVLPGQAL